MGTLFNIVVLWNKEILGYLDPFENPSQIVNNLVKLHYSANLLYTKNHHMNVFSIAAIFIDSAINHLTL